MLEADAALAYEAFLRSSGRKKHLTKINFKAEQDYIDAREHELEARGGLTVDLEKTLEHIPSKVNLKDLPCLMPNQILNWQNEAITM